MHSHPAYTIYSFADGKTKYTSPSGETSERDSQAGQACGEMRSPTRVNSWAPVKLMRY